MNRRQMLGMLGLTGAGAAVSPLALAAQQAGMTGLSIFNIKDYGAVGDGLTLNTAAINHTIDVCNASGGGVVYFPPGVYLAGTVVLKSNVTIYLEAGATLLGSKNLSDYLPLPGVATDKNEIAKHLIFARGLENVGLAGPGRIDGQGPAFWTSSGRIIPPELDWKYVLGFKWMALPRISPMLEFYNCTNVHIRDVQIENSPGWTLRPVECTNVYIQGISIKNPNFGPNTDGIDPTGCRNLFISDCSIDTGDDAICLKSEAPYGGEVKVSKNITITNCVIRGTCNGLKFGTATEGGYENVTVSNLVIYNDDVPYDQRIISGIALEMVDGGWMQGVVISNIVMQRTRTPIFIRRANRKPRPDGTPGTLQGVLIENVYATGAILTSSITGLPGFDVEDVTLSNIRIDSEEGGKASWMSAKIPEVPTVYPEAHIFGRLPSYGFYCRHVTGLRMKGVKFSAVTGEQRPAIVCDDVKDLEIGDLRPAPIAGIEPAVQLIQCQRAFIHDCWAAAGTKTFLGIQGEQTQDIVLMNNNLTDTEQVLQTGSEISTGAVRLSGNVLKA